MRTRLRKLVQRVERLLLHDLIIAVGGGKGGECVDGARVQDRLLDPRQRAQRSEGEEDCTASLLREPHVIELETERLDAARVDEGVLRGLAEDERVVEGVDGRLQQRPVRLVRERRHQRADSTRLHQSSLCSHGLLLCHALDIGGEMGEREGGGASSVAVPRDEVKRNRLHAARCRQAVLCEFARHCRNHEGRKRLCSADGICRSLNGSHNTFGRRSRRCLSRSCSHGQRRAMRARHEQSSCEHCPLIMNIEASAGRRVGSGQASGPSLQRGCSGPPKTAPAEDSYVFGYATSPPRLRGQPVQVLERTVKPSRPR